MALGNQSPFSSFIIKIAIAAVAISLATMIIATSVIAGFKKDISDKVFGFWGHIHITNYDNDRSQENLFPLEVDAEMLVRLNEHPNVDHVQAYATKAGILKFQDNIDGIFLYGVDSDFNWSFFEENLTEGKSFVVNDSARINEIVISRFSADRLGLKLNDELIVYMNKGDRPSPRKLTVSGIYKTGLQEYDEQYALMDIKHIQKINGWDRNQAGGLSVFLKKPALMDETNDEVYYNILGHNQRSRTLINSYPNIFEWLNLQDMHERILLGLLVVIASINMVTALLILILERTKMIGVLKSLGAANFSIQKVFLYNAAYIIFIGLCLGNLVGIGIALLQKYSHIIKLPEESYYLDTAPIFLNWSNLVLLNIGTLIFCLLVLLIPSILVRYISPIKALRFS